MGARHGVRLGAAQAVEVAELVAEMGLVRLALDVLAHGFEGAHVRVRAEAVERALQPHSSAGVGEAREHADLLVAQAADLLAKCDEVLLRHLGLVGERLELGGQACDLRPQRLAPAHERQARRIVVAVERRAEAELGGFELRPRVAELRIELAAQIDHAGGGATQRLVLLDALGDRRLVDGPRMAPLAAADPLGEHPAQQMPQAGSGVHALLLARDPRAQL
jgi:hypothetical protein